MLILIALACPVRAQLYSQNFSGGTAPGWTVVKGTWSVVTGTPSYYTDTALTAGPDVSYYSTLTLPDTGFSYSSSARLYGTGFGNCIGVVYYYQNTTNFYEVELNPSSPTGTVQLYEHINSAAGTVVTTGNFASNGGGNYQTVLVSRSGSTTTIKVNGTTVITHTQTALTGGGKIGGVDRFAALRLTSIVVSDTQVPTVSITAPANNATVSGTTSITASASDNVAIASVQFQLDGANLGAAVTSSPYTFSWNTTTATGGAHALTAIAKDTSNNTTTSSTVDVTVNDLPSGWSDQDIGSTGAAGSLSYSSGTYTINGAGANIWGSADQFNYGYMSITGDCTIVAEITSITNTASFAKAGVMFRETLTSASSFAAIFGSPPTVGFQFQARNGTGTNATQVTYDSTQTVPRWYKLVRAGNTFSAYSSSNGSTWTSEGSQTISMASSIYAGLGVCSLVNGTLCTATFTNVSITSGSGAYNPNFPRLGIYAIGNGSNGLGQTYPSTVWSALAKFNVVIIAGNWESWGNTRGYTREQVVDGIKAASTIGTKVFQYVMFEETGNSAANSWDPTWFATANGNKWWLYPTGTTGTQVGPGGTFWDIDMTHYVPTDPTTHLYPFQSAAQYAYNVFVLGDYGTGNGAPDLDGFFLDNTFWTPHEDGDWNRDGTEDFGFASGDSQTPSATILTAYRTGQLDFFSEMNSIWPGHINIGNNAEWPDASWDANDIANPSDTAAVSPLNNSSVCGGVNEGLLGSSFSPEAWSSLPFTTCMSYYEFDMNAVSSPQLQLCEQEDLGYNSIAGSDRYSTTAYQGMRYGICFTLMNNGYYHGDAVAPGNHSGALPDILWFDEYDNAGTALGYLGQPVAGSTGAPQTASRWSHGTLGVWAREFANGLVIVNPMGNGSQTVTTTDLGGTTLWKRINGSQAPTINNGTNVTTSITLQDRDGIILLRR